ncbi:hypothetical protein ACK3TF_005685 [Chlorella vulgaris]
MLRAVRCLPSCALLRPAASANGETATTRSGKRSQSRKAPRGRTTTSPAIERGLSSSVRQTAAAAAAATTADESESSTHLRGMSVLSRYRALLLDNSYKPVGVANWQRAICLDLMDKADVLEYYEQSVRSVQLEYFLPAVLRVRRKCNSPRHSQLVTLNRANIMLRDRYACQYCGSNRELTIDHVVAQSKGGGNTWTNLVACCAACNSKKGDKSLEQLRWKLRQQPKEPSMHEMEFVLSMLLGSTSHDSLPTEWQAYIVPFRKKKRSNV